MAGRGLVKGATFGAIGGLAGYGVGKLGDSIAGKSWTQAKREYWKTEADKRSGDYSAENLELMARGRAPRRPFNPLNGKINEPMELHHMLFPQRSGLPHVFVNARFNLKPVWPEQHAAVDPFRHYR